jgi:protease-4
MNLKLWKRSEPMPGPGDPDWEKALLNRVVMESLREQRIGRRWGIFFKLLGFAYLIALLVMLWPEDFMKGVKPAEEHTAVIDVKGIIAPGTSAGADDVVTALRKAYEDDRTKGIVLRINSPGGSPVQAGYINNEIRRLRKKHEDIPVYAVVADLCASGGYYIAVSADEIYVSEASLVGSIGVRIDSFGFEEAMEELGIERRLLTAGENKGILDPFSPLPEEQRAYLESMLDQIHQQFIAVVKEGRGDRLKGGDELFSGLIWTGEESLELGLADALGSTGYVAREVVGAEKTVKFTADKDLLERLAERLGSAFARALLEVIASGYPAVQ